jgi:hypothetical protein
MYDDVPQRNRIAMSDTKQKNKEPDSPSGGEISIEGYLYLFAVSTNGTDLGL